MCVLVSLVLSLLSPVYIHTHTHVLGSSVVERYV